MELLDKSANALLDQIVNPIIYLFSAICFVWFLYGVMNFILARFNSEQKGIDSGKRHMLWGLVGLVIIFSAGAIYQFITGFFE